MIIASKLQAAVLSPIIGNCLEIKLCKINQIQDMSKEKLWLEDIGSSSDCRLIKSENIRDMDQLITTEKLLSLPFIVIHKLIAPPPIMGCEVTILAFLLTSGLT